MNQKRIADYGIRIGTMPKGALNKITDVKGVKVGHSTIKTDKYRTGCTVIIPSEQNVYDNKLVSAVHVQNGYGKTCGTVQIGELGTIETPIALTNTLNVGIVADAMVEYTVKRCHEEGSNPCSVNAVVGECNDAHFNTIIDRPVTKEHVFEAIADAREDFEEGDVGAGTGTWCYGFKGGIGSASRMVSIGGKDFTLGVLVQSNYGSTADLMVDGKHLDEEIIQKINGSECDKGSIMIILATDIPLTARQLKRVVKRCSIGIARLGSYIGHGSGEVFIGFSTANVIREGSELMSIDCISDNVIDRVFRAAGEASEEAILNSMVCASAVRALDGNLVHSLAEYMEMR